MNTLILLVVIVFTFCNSQFHNDDPPDRIIYDTDGRIRGFGEINNSDVILGALMLVHNSLEDRGLCSDQLYVESLDYLEAFLYSIDKVNNDSSLLPNTTLGYDIRDTCITVDVAVYETVDMVLVDGGKSEECDIFDYETQFSFPVSGVIGSQVSFVSIPVASFLTVANTAQISYTSTSVLLNDRTKYPYFYRTVPSDDQQAQAMIEIALHFNWTFVSAIHSSDAYGEPGMEKFRTLAAEYGICIGVDKAIYTSSSKAVYEQVVEELLNSTADVIVIFASLKPSVSLLSYMSSISQHLNRQFTWLTSDAITLSSAIFPKYNNIISSMIGVALFSSFDYSFIDYYSTVNLLNNKRNLWYEEYYEQFYDCEQGECSMPNRSIPSSPEYEYNQNIPLVIDAVYTYAHALDAFIADNCDSPVSWSKETHRCNGQQTELNGQTLGPYIANVSFMSPSGNKIEIQETGGTDGKYIVYNYQLNSNSGEYGFVNVAIWNGLHQLTINESRSFQFGEEENGTRKDTVTSQCDQCQVGFAVVSHDELCCGTCSPCLGQAFESSNECQLCPDDQWGNDPLNGSSYCVLVTRIYNNPSNAIGVISILLACLLLLAVIGGTVLFVYSWNSNTVKNLRRDMIIVMAIGVLLSIFFTIFFEVEPSIGVCIFQRGAEHICFVILLSPLLILQTHTAWHYAVQQGRLKRNFIPIPYQRLVVLVIVILQCLLTIISLIVTFPAANRVITHAMNIPNDFPTIHLACVPSHLAMDILQLLLQAFLLISFAVGSVLSVRDPNKPYETKYTVLVAIGLIVTWIAFIISFFSVSDEHKPIVMSLSMLMYAVFIPMAFFAPSFVIAFKKVWMPKQEPNRAKTTFEYSIRSVVSNPSSINNGDIEDCDKSTKL